MFRQIHLSKEPEGFKVHPALTPACSQHYFGTAYVLDDDPLLEYSVTRTVDNIHLLHSKHTNLYYQLRYIPPR